MVMLTSTSPITRLIVQPALHLDWTLYKSDSPDAIVNQITLGTGIWNDVDTHPSGTSIGNWNEIDPSLGPTVTLFRDWKLDLPFIAYVSETSSYPTSWVFDPKLTYHDHWDWVNSFSLNPYVEVYDELQNKMTVVFAPQTSHTSFYGVIGVDPTYKFEKIPLKLELPTYATFVENNLYQRVNGTGGGSGLGLFSTMFKATVPLDFMPPGVGKWTIYAAIQEDYLYNAGLLDSNQFALAAFSRERNIQVFHAGFNITF